MDTPVHFFSLIHVTSLGKFMHSTKYRWCTYSLNNAQIFHEYSANGSDLGLAILQVFQPVINSIPKFCLSCNNRHGASRSKYKRDNLFYMLFSLQWKLCQANYYASRKKKQRRQSNYKLHRAWIAVRMLVIFKEHSIHFSMEIMPSKLSRFKEK